MWAIIFPGAADTRVKCKRPTLCAEFGQSSFVYISRYIFLFSFLSLGIRTLVIVLILFGCRSQPTIVVDWVVVVFTQRLNFYLFTRLSLVCVSVVRGISSHYTRTAYTNAITDAQRHQMNWLFFFFWKKSSHTHTRRQFNVNSVVGRDPAKTVLNAKS